MLSKARTFVSCRKEAVEARRKDRTKGRERKWISVNLRRKLRENVHGSQEDTGNPQQKVICICSGVKVVISGLLSVFD